MDLGKTLSKKYPNLFWKGIVLFYSVTLVVTLAFCDVKYEVSDDFIMEAILSGAFNGQTDPHIMFSNILWGWILKIFYMVCPGVSWYFWAQVLLCHAAFLAFVYLLYHFLPPIPCASLSIVLFVFITKDVILLMQFTKTASLTIFSGGMLFIWALFHQRKPSLLIATAVLTVAGTFVRYACAYIAGPFLLVYLAFETVEFIRSGRFEKKCLFRLYAMGGVLALSIVLLHGLNTAMYYTSEGYANYYTFNKARANIIDYPRREYEYYGDALPSIGISYNDFDMVNNWCFDDISVFSTQTMQQLSSVVDGVREELHPDRQEIIRIVQERNYTAYPILWCFVFCAVLLLLCRPRCFWIPLTAGGIAVFLLVYFIYQGRYVYRTEFSVILCAALLVALFCGKSQLNKAQTAAFCAAALLAVVWQGPTYLPDDSWETLDDASYRDYVDSTFYYSWNYADEKYTKTINRRELRSDFWEEVRENPDNVYILDFPTTIQTLYYDFSPFESAASKWPRNLFYLGGVTTQHPAVLEGLSQNGIKNQNPLQAILQRENVYFVGSESESDLLCRYFTEHYGETVKTWYNNLGGYDVWSYSLQ